MSIATPDRSSLPLPVDPTLLGAVLEAVNKGLTMCDASAKCVGISAVPSCDAPLVTGMIVNIEVDLVARYLERMLA